MFLISATQKNIVQAESVVIENQVKSSANSKNENIEEESSNDNSTGQATSESNVKIELNDNSKGKVEIKSQSKANQTESEVELDENIESLPPNFDKTQKNTNQEKGEQTEAQIKVNKQDSQERKRDETPESIGSEKENSSPENELSYLNQLKNKLISIFEDATSTLGGFFS